MYKRWDSTATNLLCWFGWDLGYFATLKRINEAFLSATVERRWIPWWDSVSLRLWLA